MSRAYPMSYDFTPVTERQRLQTIGRLLPHLLGLVLLWFTCIASASIYDFIACYRTNMFNVFVTYLFSHLCLNKLINSSKMRQVRGRIFKSLPCYSQCFRSGSAFVLPCGSVRRYPQNLKNLFLLDKGHRLALDNCSGILLLKS
jgi:hypothetical protein